MNAGDLPPRPTAPIGLECVVDEFRAHALDWGAAHEGQEAVALVGWAPDGRIQLIPLDNRHSGRDGFYVPWEALEEAVHTAAARGARRVILAHTHRGGRAVPSAVYPHGDVQNLGASQWIARVDALLAALSLPPPLLHLICVLPDGPARLFIIDERLGRIVSRQRDGIEVQTPLGWAEIDDIATLA